MEGWRTEDGGRRTERQRETGEVTYAIRLRCGRNPPELPCVLCACVAESNSE